MECPLFGILSGPGLDHVGIMFVLPFVLYQLKLQKLQDKFSMTNLKILLVKYNTDFDLSKSELI